MGLPMGQKLVKSGSTWARLCGPHISETTGWIYTIWSFMGLSRPVVVQHHGHLTLTFGFSRSNLENAVSQELKGRLTWHEWDVSRYDVTPTLWLSTFPSPMTLTFDFQGQILKKSYLRNGMADWHGIKAMWVNKMLDPCCDFQCPPHPWPWPWIFKVRFWKCCISGMGGPIDMEWKGCESIGCYTHFVTSNFDLNHDLDLGFSRSNFEKIVSQEWDGRLTWN